MPRAPHNALCAVRFLSRFLYSAPVFCSASAKRVGGDAHIDPAERTVFTEISGEFATSQWGDVGIAPYAKTEKFQKSRKGVPWGHIKSSNICKNSLPGFAGQGFLFSEDLREEVL